MMLEDHMKLCVTEPDFLEKICLSQNLLKDLVIDFYWICSIMKFYVICYVPVQILYL